MSASAGSARREGEGREVPRSAAELLGQALALLLEDEAPTAIADPEGRLLQANAEARRLLSRLAEACGGDPERIAEVESALAAPGPAGGWSQPVERERRITLGATIEIYRASVRVFRDETGEPLALVARWRAFGDAGEPRRQPARTPPPGSEEEAEGAHRSDSEFLATVSHELRTPLNAIIGFSELMQAETFGPLGSPIYSEYARDIHRSAAHLLELINDILEVSKLEAGRIELEVERIDAAAIARAVMAMVAERAVQSRITLSLELQEGLPHLWADARALRLVLLNLLTNAVKFTPEGGQVSLSASLAPGGDWLFVIEDSGIGMTPEEIEVALTPLGQVDSRLARRFPGTGLSLPLSKGLVELHGGTLEIDSRSGAGTRVTVRLPASRVLRI